MKALATQFDDRRLSNAVATPTCSSCCCCCCCLATSIAASSLLTQRIAREGEKHQVFNRHILTLVAALFVPIVGFLVYIGFWSINTLFRTCTVHTYTFSNDNYTTCTNPGAGMIFPLLLIAPFVVLWYLYLRVHIEKPMQRATIVTILIAVAFVAEFVGGAFLILTGVGGIAYLIMVPIIVGWISVWYHRHLYKEPLADKLAAAQPSQPAFHTTPIDHPPAEEHHEEKPPEQPKPAEPADPPQSKPPASGSE